MANKLHHHRHHHHLLLLLVGVGLSFLLSGCSTIATVAGGMDPESFDCDTEYEIPRVYSGVANDLRFYREGAEANVVALFDLPLSFVLDTVILPYTLFQQWRFGDLCPGASSETGEGRQGE